MLAGPNGAGKTTAADTWAMLDNTQGNRTSVAHGFFEETAHVDDFDLWYKIKEEAAHG